VILLRLLILRALSPKVSCARWGLLGTGRRMVGAMLRSFELVSCSTGADASRFASLLLPAGGATGGGQTAGADAGAADKADPFVYARSRADQFEQLRRAEKSWRQPEQRAAGDATEFGASDLKLLPPLGLDSSALDDGEEGLQCDPLLALLQQNEQELAAEAAVEAEEEEDACCCLCPCCFNKACECTCAGGKGCCGAGKSVRRGQSHRPAEDGLADAVVAAQQPRGGGRRSSSRRRRDAMLQPQQQQRSRRRRVWLAASVRSGELQAVAEATEKLKSTAAASRSAAAPLGIIAPRHPTAERVAALIEQLESRGLTAVRRSELQERQQSMQELQQQEAQEVLEATFDIDVVVVDDLGCLPRYTRIPDVHSSS